MLFFIQNIQDMEKISEHKIFCLKKFYKLKSKLH